MVLALIDDSKTDCDNLHDILVEYAAHHSNDLILHCFSSKGIWEIKLSNVIIFCHCNADIKSDLSWENMSGNFKWDRIC